MAEYLYYNNKYHLINPSANPNGWLASFALFKSFAAVNVVPYEKRPPYPILIDRPTMSQIVANLNKSDVLMYFFIMGVGFTASYLTTRNWNIMQLKLTALHVYMHFFNLLGITTALNCSHGRLTGLMDNGLRWKRKDRKLTKYDFTKDFEKHTIFKHFRERIDN
jgi:hypothetical protein